MGIILPLGSTLINFSTAGDWKVPSSGPNADIGSPIFCIVPLAITFRVPPYLGVVAVVEGAVVVGDAAAGVVFGGAIEIAGEATDGVVFGGAVAWVDVAGLEQPITNMEASKPIKMAR